MPLQSSLDATIDRMNRGRALKDALLMIGKSRVPYAQPLIDAVTLFDEIGIGYALVGGIASMYYGRPRFTEDVDFVVTSTHADLLAQLQQK